jgi:hypothetical protein
MKNRILLENYLPTDDLEEHIAAFVRHRNHQCCLAVLAPGDISVEHLALVIDRAPEVMKLTVDLCEDLVEMPEVPLVS